MSCYSRFKAAHIFPRTHDLETTPIKIYRVLGTADVSLTYNQVTDTIGDIK